MKQIRKITLLLGLLTTFLGYSQNITNEDNRQTNVQEYTPSKLLNKGQWDVKFFNSLYTQTKKTDGGSNTVNISTGRESFFTNTTEIYTGVSKNSRINIGLILQVRSNVFNGAKAFNVFSFKDNAVDARSGLTTIAPSIRVQPFKNIGNFSFTSSLYLPVFKDIPNAPYLDKRSVFWETKFFYDKTFGGGDWQVFTEVDLGFNFGEKTIDASVNTNKGERFANNSLSLPLSVFLSYFPSQKSTVFVNAQQSYFIGYDNPNANGQNFSQNYTALGFGGKYQLSKVLNIEVSYSKFIRGNNFQGLGNTVSLGLRAIL